MFRVFCVYAACFLVSGCASFVPELRSRLGYSAQANEWYQANCQRRETLRQLRTGGGNEQLDALYDIEVSKPTDNDAINQRQQLCQTLHMARNTASLRAELIEYYFPSSLVVDPAFAGLSDQADDQLRRYVQNNRIVTDHLCSTFFNSLTNGVETAGAIRNLTQVSMETISALVSLNGGSSQTLGTLSAIELLTTSVQSEFEERVFLTPDPSAVYQLVVAHQERFFNESGRFESPRDHQQAFLWALRYTEYCSPNGIQRILTDSAEASRRSLRGDALNPTISSLIREFETTLRLGLAASEAPELLDLMRGVDFSEGTETFYLHLYWYFTEDMPFESRQELLNRISNISPAAADVLRGTSARDATTILISPESARGGSLFRDLSEVWARYGTLQPAADALLQILQNQIQGEINEAWRNELRQTLESRLSDLEFVSQLVARFDGNNELARACRDLVRDRISSEITGRREQPLAGWVQDQIDFQLTRPQCQPPGSDL